MRARGADEDGAPEFLEKIPATGRRLSRVANRSIYLPIDARHRVSLPAPLLNCAAKPGAWNCGNNQRYRIPDGNEDAIKPPALAASITDR
ncbi:MAG: hypothetical protein DMF61_05640 [Blastocatellia bacterium AA13]|nr:MAG: hypothetical protein DMF61_05640 [Blastocatellia bacterium AA13]